MSIEDAFRRVLEDALGPIHEELRALRAALHEARRGPSSHEYLDTDEAADLARVTPATVREWIKQGKLRRYGSGRRLLVRASEIHELLAPDEADPIDRAVEAELRSLRVVKGK